MNLINMSSRWIGSSMLVVVLTLSALAAHAAPDEQVPFTATATAVITGVTKLPGGLTQVNFNTSGKANHLGDFTGPLTRSRIIRETLAAPRSSLAPTGRTVCSFPSVDALRTRRTSVWSLPRVLTL